jgi:hypothetical protein
MQDAPREAEAQTMDHAGSPSPEQALMTLRIIWFAMLMGPLGLFVTAAVLRSLGSAPRADPGVVSVIAYAALGLALVGIPMGYLLRSQQYKANWRGAVITPQGYLSGNILLLAPCESPGLLAGVAYLLGAPAWLTGIPLALAFTAMLANFPNGKAMRPSPEAPAVRERDQP